MLLELILEDKSSIITLLMGREGELVAENQSGQQVITDHVRHAVKFFHRLRGLMFSESLKGALIIHKCRSVHMMFMKYPIDVVFADRSGNVLKCLSNIKPWRISPFVPKAYFAVELPAGSIERNRLKEGAILKIRTLS